MKKLLCLLWLTVWMGSCKEETVPIAEDPDWIRLEIPTGREAYAIAGDIDKTLLVTTLTKAYYTNDRGKTWQVSKDFQGPVPGLLIRNDTVFALRSFSEGQDSQRFATMAAYFTLDYGLSWQPATSYLATPTQREFYSGLVQPLGIVETSSGVTYRIKENRTPVSPKSNALRTNPSEIRKEDDDGDQIVRFPFKHHLLNLHLDPNHRLYVAASGGTFVEQTNGFYCCDERMPAIVYVSRRPLP